MFVHVRLNVLAGPDCQRLMWENPRGTGGKVVGAVLGIRLEVKIRGKALDIELARAVCSIRHTN